jgi:plasmid stabilization system protein ParE
MNYTFHPHAEKELEQIETDYYGIREELGDRFREEIQRTISRVLKFPNGCTPLAATIRYCKLIKFPYGIIYRIRPAEIRILAVTHHRRRPYYWAYRT